MLNSKQSSSNNVCNEDNSIGNVVADDKVYNGNSSLSRLEESEHSTNERLQCVFDLSNKSSDNRGSRTGRSNSNDTGVNDCQTSLNLRQMDNQISDDGLGNFDISLPEANQIGTSNNLDYNSTMTISTEVQRKNGD